mgnify:CR=1 FL=1
MECKHAYRRDDVDYIICDYSGKVTSNKLSEVAPKLCLHQRFCPNVRNCTLLPSWVECTKLKEEALKETEPGALTTVKKVSTKKKS